VIEDLPENRVVADNIARLRRSREWTQADLAESLTKLGLRWTRSVVARIEREGRPLLLSEAIRVAHALDVDVTALLDSDDEEIQNLADWTCSAGRDKSPEVRKSLEVLYQLTETERALTEALASAINSASLRLSDVRESLTRKDSLTSVGS
jgi:transcriptional regulator with XRE-family HTH domain